ncbi:hypothetical protein WICPIJ_005707 [Wickerhamomyces pijperi]|uniref:Uncharacterized protein n=1 Tax=Wickerhamomyces pijperi TaxID=599730 RepID=A0A9P8TLK5_WICPI|nr:hypothetical protein WICPIJ_005707 [Wickerhamomyces pijperi]
MFESCILTEGCNPPLLVEELAVAGGVFGNSKENKLESLEVDKVSVCEEEEEAEGGVFVNLDIRLTLGIETIDPHELFRLLVSKP